VDIEGASPFPKAFRWLPAPLKKVLNDQTVMNTAIVKQVMDILRDPPLRNDRALRASFVQQLRRTPGVLNGANPESTLLDGDIIVFVPSVKTYGEICRTLDTLRKKENLPAFFCTRLEGKSGKRNALDAKNKPIYMRHEGKNVTEETFATHPTLYHDHPDNNPNDPYTRKIVIATEVAESSVTIEGATYVVDTAVAIGSIFHPRMQMDELRSYRVAKDAICQRRGRVGRKNPGLVYHLYTEDEFNQFDEITTPDVRTTDQGAEVLGILSMVDKDSVLKMREFYSQLFEAPKDMFLQSACRTLRLMSALTEYRDQDTGRLTPNSDQRTMLGRAMSFFRSPFTLAQAKSLILSESYSCSTEMAQIVAMLQASKVTPLMMTNTASKRSEQYLIPAIFVSQYGDHLTLLHIYRQYEYECKKNGHAATFCTKHHFNSNYFNGIELMVRKIKSTLHEKVFHNEDPELRTILDDDVMDLETINEFKGTEKGSPKKGYPNRTHNPNRDTRPKTRGGSFALLPDYTLDEDATNPSGKLDLDVLFALFPGASGQVPEVLREMAKASGSVTPPKHPSMSHPPLSTLYDSPAAAADQMSECIWEFRPTVFHAMTPDQQQNVGRALDTTIRHRKAEHERVRQQMRDDPQTNQVEADVEARSHQKWLDRLQQMQRKVRRANHVQQQQERRSHNRSVMEVLGAHHFYNQPADRHDPQWSNVEYRVMRALVEGYLTQCALRTKQKGQYITIASEDPQTAGISDTASTLTSTYWKTASNLDTFDVVLYESLFKGPTGKVSLQRVSVLPAHVRNDTTVKEMLRRCAGTRFAGLLGGGAEGNTHNNKTKRSGLVSTRNKRGRSGHSHSQSPSHSVRSSRSDSSPKFKSMRRTDVIRNKALPHQSQQWSKKPPRRLDNHNNTQRRNINNNNNDNDNNSRNRNNNNPRNQRNNQPRHSKLSLPKTRRQTRTRRRGSLHTTH